jgi:hypothetical protein
MNEGWSLSEIRALYQSIVRDDVSPEALSERFGRSARAVGSMARELYLVPRDDAPSLEVVEDIWRRSVERPRMSAAEIDRLKALWVGEAATLRSVGLALRRRLDLVRKKARALGLGLPGQEARARAEQAEVEGEALGRAETAARLVLDPRSTLGLKEAAARCEVPIAAARAALKALDPDHRELLPSGISWVCDDETGPRLSEVEIVARRQTVLADRARKLVAGGVSCPRALARELDPLRVHRLSPIEAAQLGGLEAGHV